MTAPFQALTLLIPEKADVERDAVAAAWAAGGGTVLRLGRFWDPPPLEPESVRVYGNDTFCLVLAQKLGLDLISPADELLTRLTDDERRRWVRALDLAEVGTLAFPVFLKSAVPKLFTAAVYGSIAELDEQTRGLEPNTRVLASEVVRIEAEVRAFVLDGQVMTLAAYEGSTSSLTSAEELVASVAARGVLPRTCVLDVGLVIDRGWAVIEANSSWGAGLNGCDASAACQCVAAACRPLA